MIEYALLCQTITDWRAGRRPTLPQSAAPTMVATGAAGGTAPIAIASLEDDGSEVIDAGDADIEDDSMYATSDELDTEVPVDEEYAPADAGPPPDYDSTMVYGAGGAMPGQWPAEGDLGGATPPTGLVDPADGKHEPPRS
jgi:hypothetical protein